jgi:glycosyltransferase involved in cell wall biosynthesis
MITTFYPPYSFGGDAMFVQQLCHELARRGHHVEVIHCADAYRAVAGDEPCPGAPEPPIGALRFRPRPAAVTLQTLHEYWLVCPTHMLFKYEREPCRAPRCVACTIAHRRPPQLWRSLGILRRAAAQVDVFITASRFAGDKHAELGFGRAIEILPPFTTRAPAPAPAAGWPPGSGPYFLFVGRLERVKGLQTLIPLFRRSTRARLLVAGTGSYEASLRRLAADAPNIAWLGHQSGDRLNQTCMVGPARDRPDVPASVRSSAVLGRGLRAPVRQPARAPA